MTYTPPAEQSVTLSLTAEAYVSLGTDIGIDFTNRSAFTIEGWFKFNGLCPDSTLFEKPGQFAFKTRGQKVSASFVGQPMPLETDDILNTETDFHVAVTYDGQTLSLYVNGLLRVQSSFSFTPPPANQNPAVIGRDLQAYCHYVRLWSVARQQDEIYANEWTYLTSGTGLQAAYAFYDYPARDVSPNDRSLTLMNGARSESTAPCLLYAGTAYCQPLQDTDVNPGGDGTDDYTILAWIRLQDLGTQQAILCNGDLNLESGIVLYVDTDGTVVGRRGSASGASVTSGSTKLQPNLWYSIGYTYAYDSGSGSGTQTLYVNGVQAGSGTAGPITALAQGDIILGAADDSATANQLMNMNGYMQFLSVWNTALAEADIQHWMYHDPTTETACLANYNFSTPPLAQDLVDGNPMALVRGADLVVLRTIPVSDGATDQDVLHRLAPPRPQKRFSNARMVGAPEPTEPFRPAEMPNADNTRAWVEHFARQLPNNLPHGEHQRLRREFQTAVDDAIANPEPAFQVLHEIDGDDHVLILVNQDGHEEIFRAARDELDDCTVWKVRLIVTVLIGVYTVFGPIIRAGPVTNWLGERINTVGFWPQVSAIFNAGVTPNSFLQMMRLLYEFGWITTVGKLMLAQLSWWDVAVIGLRVASLLVPGAAALQVAYFLAKVVYSVASVVTVWNDRPAGC
jgi:hypothetical protein